MADSSTPDAVIRRARLQGLITGNPCRHWQVGDGAVTHALTRHGLRWPTQPQSLAAIMLGLGELDARCHVKLWPIVLPQLAKLSVGQEDTILAEAFAQTLATARSVSLGDHSAAQLLSANGLSWKLLQDAKALVAHPWEIASTSRYGLQSVVRWAIHRKPRAVADILRRHRDHPLTASIVRAAVHHLQRAAPERVQAVARTKIPLLIALTAARIADEPTADPTSNASRFSEGRQLLVDSGVNEVDATCLMTLHFKEAVHQRFRLAHAIRDMSLQLRWLQTQTAPLSPFDAHELSHLPTQLADRRQRAEQHEKAFDRILDDMARHWPQQGLGHDHLALVAPTFVGSEELRYRLAMSLTAQSARAQLLQLNFDAWMSDVGLRQVAIDSFDQDFHPRADDFLNQTLWAARSFIALHPDAKGGIGRQTGLLLKPMKDAADALLDEPYLADRQSVRWQSALLRSTALAIFALLVVSEIPAERRPETSTLAGFALDHAREVLIQGEVIGARQELSDRLAGLAIWRMAQDPSLTPRLPNWADEECLPIIVRAMAAWSSPPYIEANVKCACRLFVEAGQPPLSRRGIDGSFDQLMSLLDIAVATTAQLNDRSYEYPLVDAWSEVIEEWPDQRVRWRNAADWLLQAMKSKGVERDALLSNPAFQESRCRQAIESTV